MKDQEKKQRIPGNRVWKNDPDVVWELCGCPYNTKYEPQEKGNTRVKYHGYATEAGEIQIH